MEEQDAVGVTQEGVASEPGGVVAQEEVAGPSGHVLEPPPPTPGPPPEQQQQQQQQQPALTLDQIYQKIMQQNVSACRVCGSREPSPTPHPADNRILFRTASK